MTNLKIAFNKLDDLSLDFDEELEVLMHEAMSPRDMALRLHGLVRAEQDRQNMSEDFWVLVRWDRAEVLNRDTLRGFVARLDDQPMLENPACTSIDLLERTARCHGFTVCRPDGTVTGSVRP